MLQGCIYVPTTTETYDPECQIVARQMELKPVQIASFGNCNGNDCVTMLAIFGATAAASAVVSGSIVIAGNVVHWFEKQNQCIREPR